LKLFEIKASIYKPSSDSIPSRPLRAGCPGECPPARCELAQPQRARRSGDGHFHDACADVQKTGRECLRIPPRPPQPPLRNAISRTMYPTSLAISHC